MLEFFAGVVVGSCLGVFVVAVCVAAIAGTDTPYFAGLGIGRRF